MQYWNNICALNARQEAKGKEKYGQTLEDNVTLTVTQRIEHTEEELIDALKYMEHLKAACAGEGFTLDDYQRAAMRTADGMDKEYPPLFNGVLGLAGESGECADIVKKHLFQGHELDEAHLAEELGDVLWYVAVSAQAIGKSLSDIAQGNVDKLMRRYPQGFDKARSVNRDE